jgi:hypothetical protein
VKLFGTILAKILISLKLFHSSISEIVFFFVIYFTYDKKRKELNSVALLFIQLIILNLFQQYYLMLYVPLFVCQ